MLENLNGREKRDLKFDLQEITAQCMLDHCPDVTHIDNEYVAGFIENSDASIFEDALERIGIEFDEDHEDEYTEMLIEFILQVEKFNLEVKGLDYSSESNQ